MSPLRVAPEARTRRERLIMRLPKSFMEYPFEVFVGVYGVLAAAAVLVGGGVPKSMAAFLPHFLVVAWGITLALGGITTLVGLRVHSHFVIAMGLRLISGALALFVGIAAWVVQDAAIIPSALLVLFIAVLSGFRSFYLKTTTLVSRRLRRER